MLIDQPGHAKANHDHQPAIKTRAGGRHCVRPRRNPPGAKKGKVAVSVVFPFRRRSAAPRRSSTMPSATIRDGKRCVGEYRSLIWASVSTRVMAYDTSDFVTKYPDRPDRAARLACPLLDAARKNNRRRPRAGQALSMKRAATRSSLLKAEDLISLLGMEQPVSVCGISAIRQGDQVDATEAMICGTPRRRPGPARRCSPQIRHRGADLKQGKS